MYSPILVVVLAFVLSSEACSRRRRPPPPPPRAPPPPKAPPPIVKVVRTQEQNVGFNKCYRRCTGENKQIDPKTGLPVQQESVTANGVNCRREAGAPTSTYGGGILETDNSDEGFKTPGGDPCAMATDCKYVCEFEVFTEVALRTISKPTHCGCAFHINIVKPRAARVVGNVKGAAVAQEVTVSDFKLVVWNHKSNRVVLDHIEGFDLKNDEVTKQRIAQQVQAGNTEDFTSLTAGFAGQVTRFEALPKALDLNLPENADHVPALRFTVTQTYIDTKTWDPPQEPDLNKMPNAYQSQCVPYWSHKPFCYNAKKRQTGIDAACDQKKPSTFMKKFFLFPKPSVVAKAQGLAYKARMITSFYTTADCSVEHGFFSIDSEFDSKLSASGDGAEMALGTWGWTRIFDDGNNGQTFGTRYVNGVPAKFSKIQEVWDKGFSTIKWFLHKGRGIDSTHDEVLKSGICQSFEPSAAPTIYAKYGELEESFPKQGGIKCAPFDDVIQKKNCGTAASPDNSLMAFINPGAVLNFNKNEYSILLMGKAVAGCKKDRYTDTVFDVLTFHGVEAGAAPVSPLEKRSVHGHFLEAGLIYDSEAQGLRHFLHHTSQHFTHMDRKRSEKAAIDKLIDNLATPPNEENWDMNMAMGSIDAEGAGVGNANDGDHPLELFPETFSAPVNIDPQVDAEIVEAEVTTGSLPPACNKGSIGCDCRVTGTSACDIGLECDFKKTCMLKDCAAGNPGCSCTIDNKCNPGSDCKVFMKKVNGKQETTTVCAEISQCELGTAGCACNGGGCSAGECTDGICLLPVGECADGDAGCTCDLENTSGKKCKTDGFSCDALMGACLAPRCATGSAGCRCQGDGSCDAGFECTDNICQQFACKQGDPGCQCLKGGDCNKIGFECIPYSSDGDERCVASSDTCGDAASNAAKCRDFCGTGNVKICPTCANGEIYCKEQSNELLCKEPSHIDSWFCQNCLDDPFKAGCEEAPASVTTLSVLAAAVATYLSL